MKAGEELGALLAALCALWGCGKSLSRTHSDHPRSAWVDVGSQRCPARPSTGRALLPTPMSCSPSNRFRLRGMWCREPSVSDSSHASQSCPVSSSAFRYRNVRLRRFRDHGRQVGGRSVADMSPANCSAAGNRAMSHAHRVGPVERGGPSRHRPHLTPDRPHQDSDDIQESPTARAAHSSRPAPTHSPRHRPGSSDRAGCRCSPAELVGSLAHRDEHQAAGDAHPATGSTTGFQSEHFVGTS